MARSHSQHAYALTQETNNGWMMAYALGQLGNVARALGDYDQAWVHYQASYSRKEELKDPEGMAVALTHMARTAWLQRDFQEAEGLYQRSAGIYRDIHDRGGQATALHGLGDTARKVGDPKAASRYLRQALQIATEIHWAPLTFSILVSIGEVFAQAGQEEHGIELIVLALHHLAREQGIRERAEQLLSGYEMLLPPERMASIARRAEESDLDTVAAALLAELAVLAETTDEDEPGSAPAPGVPGLVEPFTARELEVLEPITAGLTNRQIAEERILSIGTVKSYTGQIYGKLGVHSRTQAVARAREVGLLS